MKRAIIFSVEVILIIQLISCHKDKDPKNIKSATDKYIIEMNSDHKLSRVTHFDANNTSIDDRGYFYSDKEVIVIDFNSHAVLSTFFLNTFGLADSCIEGSDRIKYQYNSEKYLISYSYYPYTFLNTLSYINGNKIYVANFPLHGLFYEYSSIPNLIDLESFKGTYLGNLNNNLILTKRDQWGPMAKSNRITAYEYVLNADGLVSKRTGTRTDNSSLGDPKPTDKLITYFEYKIIN